jgi:hypothetical protein
MMPKSEEIDHVSGGLDSPLSVDVGMSSLRVASMSGDSTVSDDAMSNDPDEAVPLNQEGVVFDQALPPDRDGEGVVFDQALSLPPEQDGEGVVFGQALAPERDGEECLICLEPLNGTVARCGACPVAYHDECAQGWIAARFADGAGCPLCRTPWTLPRDDDGSFRGRDVEQLEAFVHPAGHVPVAPVMNVAAAQRERSELRRQFGATYTASAARRARERRSAVIGRQVNDARVLVADTSEERDELSNMAPIDVRVRFLRAMLVMTVRRLPPVPNQQPPSRRRRLNENKARYYAAVPDNDAHREIVELEPFEMPVVRRQRIINMTTAKEELDVISAQYPTGTFEPAAMADRERRDGIVDRRHAAARHRLPVLEADQRELVGMRPFDMRLNYLDDVIRRSARARAAPVLRHEGSAM